MGVKYARLPNNKTSRLITPKVKPILIIANNNSLLHWALRSTQKHLALYAWMFDSIV